MKHDSSKKEPKKEIKISEGEKEIAKSCQPEEEELNILKQKYVELKNQLSKERANLLNYKKNEGDRIEQRLCGAEKNLLFELIAIIDNFEHTVQSLKKQVLPENENFLKGIEMIYNQFKSFLSSRGCNSYDSLNEVFNPSLHEAFETIEDNDLPDNIVKEEICKGFTYKDTIIRPAKVKVIQNKPNN